VLDGAEARRLAFLHGVSPLLDAVAVLAGEPRPIVAADGAAQIAAFRSGQGAPVFRLTGGDLMRQGIPPGPEIGRRLAEAKRAWLAAGCADELAP
jgi:hypothetical protein